ncbi:MAG: alpha/beta hydrolase [Prolixibacteraceae bacterium]|nr:alpha/beta hydrolase [Prolixibacteraceae bacterium]
MKKKLLSFYLFLLLGVSSVQAQHFEVKKSTLLYKIVGGDSLKMTVYKPLMAVEMPLPAIVFFFGGGWVSGTPDHFQMQATYLASRGVVAICPDYRTFKKNRTTPFECVKDARSAMRFVKINGTKMGIDTNKIVASGGSAGGHLAACTALINNINEETDNLKISPKPFALVLFNPVVDTGKKGYGQKKLAGREFKISPVHHITSGAPPTLIMHGKADTTVPYENVVRFRQVMKQEGNKCILAGYKKQNHGFFNFNKKPRYFKKTLKKTENFLTDYNLLKGTSWLKKYYKELKIRSD